jgi:hypothetical protein
MYSRPCNSQAAKLGAVDLSEIPFTKSSLSMGNGNCVEVAHVSGHYLMRDSKDRTGPTLQFTPDEWNAFIGGIHNGEFDSV